MYTSLEKPKPLKIKVLKKTRGFQGKPGVSIQPASPQLIRPRSFLIFIP